MKSSGVIVRFLSLLDVALILLGVLMLTLMQTTLSTDLQANSSSTEQPSALNQITFIYLYVGWKGEQRGKCYLLDESMRIDREVSMSSKHDINSILEERKGITDSTSVVILMFDSDGWFSTWPSDDSKFDELEDIWAVEVIPVYNVKMTP